MAKLDAPIPKEQKATLRFGQPFRSSERLLSIVSGFEIEVVRELMDYVLVPLSYCSAVSFSPPELQPGSLI